MSYEPLAFQIRYYQQLRISRSSLCKEIIIDIDLFITDCSRGALPLEVVDSIMEFLPPEDLVAQSFFMPPNPLTVQFQNLPEHT